MKVEKRLAAAVGNYMLTLDENPLSGHPERLPLRVVWRRPHSAIPRRSGRSGDITRPREPPRACGRVEGHASQRASFSLQHRG